MTEAKVPGEKLTKVTGELVDANQQLHDVFSLWVQNKDPQYKTIGDLIRATRNCDYQGPAGFDGELIGTDEVVTNA